MRLNPVISIIVCVAAVGLVDSRAAGNDSEHVPVPCLDTNGDARLKLQVAGPKAGSPQKVFGVITSWDPNSQSIGFNSRLTKKAEQILVKSIQWDLPEISPVAQKAPPSYQSLGELSLTFRAEDLTVVAGVLRFPGCARKHDGKLLAFEGTVSFGGKEALLKGKVFEIHPSQGGGSSDSTGRKGG